MWDWWPVAGQGVVGDVDGGFGDAVHVDDGGGVRVALGQGVEAVGVEGLAAEDDACEGEVVGQVGLVVVGGDELVEGGGGLAQGSDVLAR